MSRRILHIIDSLGRTGASKQLLLLSEGLARRGYEVHVAALDSGGPLVTELEFAEIPTTIVGRRFMIDPLAAARLRRHLRRLQPKVVHTWSQASTVYGDFALNGGAWGRGVSGWGRARGKSLGSPRFIVGQYRIERWKTPLMRAIEQRLARRVDQFVSNSDAVRGWCVANGLPAEKFTVIQSGVPCATDSDTVADARTGGASGTRFALQSDVLREELLQDLRLPTDAKLIGIVGRLVPEKRVRDLIWAADLLRVLHDNLRVLIIGDGPLRGQLERYARLASDLEHIQFLGERDDVWRIMPHLDVLWNGSDNTSQSMAILEAMAAGVPVIASDVAVNRELVVDGDTGYLTPIGSRAGRAARARCTDRIFTNNEVAAYLGAASRQRAAEHFNAEQALERYIAVHDGIMD